MKSDYKIRVIRRRGSHASARSIFFTRNRTYNVKQMPLRDVTNQEKRVGFTEKVQAVHDEVVSRIDTMRKENITLREQCSDFSKELKQLLEEKKERIAVVDAMKKEIDELKEKQGDLLRENEEIIKIEQNLRRDLMNMASDIVHKEKQHVEIRVENAELSKQAKMHEEENKRLRRQNDDLVSKMGSRFLVFDAMNRIDHEQTSTVRREVLKVLKKYGKKADEELERACTCAVCLDKEATMVCGDCGRLVVCEDCHGRWPAACVVCKKNSSHKRIIYN